jgi:radical SAM superfamily enzyme YgiQ (UPF0313 family)
MKILLISPSRNPETKTPKGIRIPEIALLIVAGLTPDEHEVTIIEEELDDVSFDTECDLVGISCMTSNAPRAYYFAREFRKRGRTVVLGGVHPSILPEEAGRFADSVVIGEAEGVWRELLKDQERGNLQPSYQKREPSLDTYVHVRQRINGNRSLFNVKPIVTTRGCPYNCEFCCVHDIYGKKIRHIPVENVVRDIADSGTKNFIFLDDNIIGDVPYAKELFSAIKPLKIRWAGQASISFAKNEALMDAAAKSGCKALFIGLETVSPSHLKTLRKSPENIEDVEEAIKKINGKGIHFHPSLIFGFDDDTRDIFKETLDFLERNTVSSASINVLTPYPGTKVYGDFRKNGRLLTEDWKHYDHCTTVFQPKNMSARELQEGTIWTKREFTKLPSVLRRLPGHFAKLPYHLALNLGSSKGVKNEIRMLPELVSTLYRGQPAGRLLSG